MKTWAMRGTLHLLTPAAAPAFLSLMASARTWERPVWQRSFGATPQEVAALADRVSVLLDGTVLTREELVSAIVADKRFAGMEEQLRSGWGALLKPLAWQGALCHAPGRGNKAAFTRPDSLAPDWPGVPVPDEAAPVAIAAYLSAYGPATPETFDAWLTRSYLRKTTLRKWFEGRGDRLTEVDVEGEAAYILTEHADELARTKPSRSVHLLGAFDQYVLGPGTKDAQLLLPEHRDVWVEGVASTPAEGCGVVTVMQASAAQAAVIAHWRRGGYALSPGLIRFSSELAMAAGDDSPWSLPAVGDLSETEETVHRHLESAA